MSANIILEDFIWMLKVLIIVMIHIIATSAHWVLNSRFFRWQQHQENIASQVKFFAEVSPRSNPSQLHFRKYLPGQLKLGKRHSNCWRSVAQVRLWSFFDRRPKPFPGLTLSSWPPAASISGKFSRDFNPGKLLFCFCLKPHVQF